MNAMILPFATTPGAMASGIECSPLLFFVMMAGGLLMIGLIGCVFCGETEGESA